MPEDAWWQRAEKVQRVLNERPIPSRRIQRDASTPIPVTARIVWELDGVQLLDTYAVGWTTQDVRVEISDDRRYTIGLWLSAGDVERRRTSGSPRPAPPD